MPRKKLRSFFTALPPDLRYAIRTRPDPSAAAAVELSEAAASTSISLYIGKGKGNGNGDGDVQAGSWGTSNGFAGSGLPQFLPTQPDAGPSRSVSPSSSASSSFRSRIQVMAEENEHFGKRKHRGNGQGETMNGDDSAQEGETQDVDLPPVVKSVRRETKWTSKSAVSLPEEEGQLASAKRRKGKNGKVVGHGSGQAGEVKNSYEGHPWDCTGLVPRYTTSQEVPKHIEKYWWQRHRLFPAYDTLPLLLDETGWFSVTPQAIAAGIANRCRADVVLDAFCGVGGNAIEFARTCERVIAMDNNPTRLRLARHNALQLGVADRIEFVLADYVEWARTYAKGEKREKIDVVFLSPPWGGPDYLNSDCPMYPLSAILPIPGDELFALTASITPNIAYFLPRNIDVHAVGALAAPLDTPVADAVSPEGDEGAVRDKEWVNVEEEWVGDKLKAVTVYYGGLVDDE